MNDNNEKIIYIECDEDILDALDSVDDPYGDDEFYNKLLNAIAEWILRECPAVQTIERAMDVVASVKTYFDGLDCRRFDEIVEIIKIATGTDE